MKYPPSHKEEVHQKLLNNASEQVRLKGIDKVSVKSVMESEGMTVGGFYAHFDSKEDLVAHAIKEAFATTYVNFYDKIESKSDSAWTKKVIERYLSDYHRDTPSLSCPAATLMGDMSRANSEIREAFQGNLRKLISTFESRVGKTKATGLLAMLAGGLQLARSVEDEEFSNDILKSCVRSARALVKG